MNSVIVTLNKASFNVAVKLNDQPDLRLIWKDYQSKWEPLIISFLEQKLHEAACEYTEGENELLPDALSSWFNFNFNDMLKITASNYGLQVGAKFKISEENTSAVNVTSLSVAFTEEVDIAASCSLLAFLLQDESVVDGVPEHLFALRRCIIYGVVKKIKKNSWVTFDAVQVRQILEEWLVVELKDFSVEDSSKRDDYSFTRVKLPLGRSSGFVSTGPRGVGKTTFCKCFIECLIEMAPWLVNVVYCPDYDENGRNRSHAGSFASEIERNSISDNCKTPVKYFDGGQFVLVGKSNDHTMTIPKFFSLLKTGSQLGKIVITLLDNVDLLTSGKDSDQYLRQMYYHMERIEYEYFIFCTSSATGMVKETLTNAPYPSIMRQFPILKIYDLSLSLRFDFIKKQVAEVKGLAFDEKIVTTVRELAASQENLSTEEKVPLINRLHNMCIQDLRRVSLSVAIIMAQEIQKKSVCDISFSEGLRRALSSRTIYEGLAPAVTGSLEWVFDDLLYTPVIGQVADKILHSIYHQKKVIHFVRLLADQDLPSRDLQENLLDRHMKEKGLEKLAIPMNSVYSLMHHLHMRKGFRSSFVLGNVFQLLPNAAFHSSLVPYSSANPFNEFYWTHKDSMIVLNDLETLVGFHEEFGESNVNVEGRSFSEGQDVAQSSSIGEHIGFNNDYSYPFGTSVLTGNVVVDNLMFGLNTLTGIDANVGTNFGGGISFANSWNSEVVKHYQMVNSKGSSAGFMPEMDGFYGLTSGKSYKQASDKGFGKTKMEGLQSKLSFSIKHPEASSKLIMGLKQVVEASVRDIDRISNVIIIFYKRPMCYEEMIIKKLGWSLEGEYYPNIVGCKHFQKHVEIQFSCCSSWYSCLQCHNEKEAHSAGELLLSRCLFCYSVFKPTTSTRLHCSRCERKLAEFYCFACKLWHHEKDITHCSNCNKCYLNDYYPYHKEFCK